MTTRDQSSEADAAVPPQMPPQLHLVEDNGAVASPNTTGGPRIVVRAAPGWGSKGAASRPTRLDASGRWLARDCLGYACLGFTWGIMLYAELVVLRVMLTAAPSTAFSLLCGAGFHGLMGLALVAHLKCAFSDPGAIPLNSASPESILRLGPMPDGRDRVVYKCSKCDCIKPDRTHHCSVCGRCIRRMDHHCPWVNNCVGQRNQKYFVLFTGYISLTSFFSIYMSLHFFVICLGTEWEGCSNGPSPPVSTMLLLVLMILSLLFGIFTIVMACSQVAAILTNTTGIEKIKGEHREVRGLSKVARLEVVFGHPFSWRWLSPFHSPRLRIEDQGMELCSA